MGNVDKDIFNKNGLPLLQNLGAATCPLDGWKMVVISWDQKDLLNGVGFNGMNKWGDPGNVEVNKLWIIL